MQQSYAIGAAAAKIGRSVDTLRDWDRTGRLKARRDSTGRRFYTDEDIELGRQRVAELEGVRARGIPSAPKEAA